ncbi:MAG: hypothetical protein WB630_00245 [Candidatus Acidiferrales bacterium]
MLRITARVYLLIGALFRFVFMLIIRIELQVLAERQQTAHEQVGLAPFGIRAFVKDSALA